MLIKYRKLKPNAAAPVRGSASAAGADLRACIDGPVTIAPGETAMLGTGLALEIPEGCVGLVFARSGLASKRGLAPANKVGVIDSDYRGEVTVALHNHGSAPQTLAPGERIAQIVVVNYQTPEFAEAESLTDTARGTGGFGSTGMK